MTNPFTYRPPNAEDTDWEDNFASNAMAWFSDTFLTVWCTDPSHWSSKVGNYLWTDCGCCAFFRGLAIGILVMLVLGVIF